MQSIVIVTGPKTRLAEALLQAPGLDRRPVFLLARQNDDAQWLAARYSGHTVLLVSHSPEIVEELCDRAILLEQGQIRVEGLPKRICEEYSDVTSRRASMDLEPVNAAG